MTERMIGREIDLRIISTEVCLNCCLVCFMMMIMMITVIFMVVSVVVGMRGRMVRMLDEVMVLLLLLFVPMQIGRGEMVVVPGVNEELVHIEITDSTSRDLTGASFGLQRSFLLLLIILIRLLFVSSIWFCRIMSSHVDEWNEKKGEIRNELYSFL